METRGVWAHPKVLSRNEVANIPRQLAAANMNTVFVISKDVTGYALYGSKVAPVDPEYGNFDVLDVLTREAEEYGVEVHAKTSVFAEGGGIRCRGPGPMLKAHPEWSVVTREGKALIEHVKGKVYGDYWACPARPEVREHELAIIKEFAEKYEVDGVQLDFVRYPGWIREVGMVGGCFCDYCKEAFKKEYGVDVSTLPLDEVRWTEWCCSNITSFVEEAARAVKSVEPKCVVGAAVFGNYYSALVRVKQDWAKFSRYLDYIAPMLYFLPPEDFTKRTRDAVERVGDRNVYAGINGILGARTMPTFTMDIDYVIDCIKRAREVGARGVIIWKYAQLFNKGDVQWPEWPGRYQPIPEGAIEKLRKQAFPSPT